MRSNRLKVSLYRDFLNVLSKVLPHAELATDPFSTSGVLVHIFTVSKRLRLSEGNQDKPENDFETSLMVTKNNDKHKVTQTNEGLDLPAAPSMPAESQNTLQALRSDDIQRNNEAVIAEASDSDHSFSIQNYEELLSNA
ncbi:hypothetical protein FGB62_302g013 [Gracilaria domingensis]|nr:hypothetical protein FGB62_302g013 [Gracilaria domingensis]